MRIIDWSSDVGPSDLVAFNLERHDFFADLRRKACGSPLNQTEAWAIFNQFFTAEMHRQPMAPGASRALSIISAPAAVAVLTIGRASCRERVCTDLASSVVAGDYKKKTKKTKNG